MFGHLVVLDTSKKRGLAMPASRLDSVVCDDRLDRYYREMVQHELLTAEQEIALAQDIERREVAGWSEVLRLVAEGDPAQRRALLGSSAIRAARELDAPLARVAADPGAVAEVAAGLAAVDQQHQLRTAVLVDLRREGQVPASLERVEALAARAREAFITANLRLVVSIARRFRGRGLPLPDLVQEGNLGLMRAVDRFDYRKGFRFSTFATWWIMASVRRAVLDKGRTVRIPIHLVDEQRRLGQVKRDLESRLRRPPTVAELAVAAEMTPARVADVEAQVLLHPISLDRSPDDDGGGAHDYLIDPENEEEPLLERLELAMVKRDLARLVAGLSPVEADVIRRRYGMGDGDEQTLQEIGEDYARSRERIRQIESRALAKLRRALRRADRPAAERDRVGRSGPAARRSGPGAQR
jgi:RNA polymerase primary sigma factor